MLLTIDGSIPLWQFIGSIELTKGWLKAGLIKLNGLDLSEKDFEVIVKYFDEIYIEPFTYIYLNDPNSDSILNYI